MKTLIPAIDRHLLQTELTTNTFVRNVRGGENKIFIVNIHNAPNTLREIGRLRELTFRAAGGGTDKDCDLDDFDTSEQCYQQLIVWDQKLKKLLAATVLFVA